MEVTLPKTRGTMDCKELKKNWKNQELLLIRKKQEESYIADEFYEFIILHKEVNWRTQKNLDQEMMTCKNQKGFY